MTGSEKNSRDPGEKKESGYKNSVKRSKIAGILCIALIAAVVFLMSSYFDVKRIEVRGNTVNTENAIVSASGIKKGESIFFMDAHKAENKVSKLKNVAGVTVTRDLPGTVIIDVDEAIESAYIADGDSEIILNTDNTSDSSSTYQSPSYEYKDAPQFVRRRWERYVAINEKGVVIDVSGETKQRVPVITGVELVSSRQGQFIALAGSDAKEKSDLITRAVSELKAQGIISKIREINLSDLNNIYMILDTDTLVNFGKDGDEEGDNIEHKIAFLRPILSEPRQNGGVIELSDTNNVTERASVY